jgi:hypothetical protein
MDQAASEEREFGQGLVGKEETNVEILLGNLLFPAKE